MCGKRLVAFGVWLAMTAGLAGVTPMQEVLAQQGDCRIKGNISQKSGERIYHVPGQRYYADTKIDTQYGERWFCSEEEALAAGWRKSKV